MDFRSSYGMHIWNIWNASVRGAEIYKCTRSGNTHDDRILTLTKPYFTLTPLPRKRKPSTMIGKAMPVLGSVPPTISRQRAGWEEELTAAREAARASEATTAPRDDERTLFPTRCEPEEAKRRLWAERGSLETGRERTRREAERNIF